MWRHRRHREHSDTEETLLAALKAGDAMAWRTLLAAHGPQLLAYAGRMLGDRDAAEEILQDSLMNIYRAIDRFDGRCSIKSWLYRSVHNRAIDEIRRRKKYVDIGEDPEADFFDAAGRWRDDFPGFDGFAAKALDDKRLLQLVREKLDDLPHVHREVLLLKEVDDLATSEICDALEISAGNLRIRLHRARTALRAAVFETAQGV